MHIFRNESSYYAAGRFDPLRQITSENYLITGVPKNYKDCWKSISGLHNTMYKDHSSVWNHTFGLVSGKISAGPVNSGALQDRCPVRWPSQFHWLSINYAYQWMGRVGRNVLTEMSLFPDLIFDTMTFKMKSDHLHIMVIAPTSI